MQAHANSDSFRYANKRMLVWILADDIYIYIYLSTAFKDVQRLYTCPDPSQYSSGVKRGRRGL